MKRTLKTLIRQQLMALTGYWIYKKTDLPGGIDMFEDIARLSNIKSINTVFDVGANLGQSVDYYRARLPNASIYSFEPIKSVFEQLEKNTGGLDNVKTFNIALGDSESKTTVKYYEGEQSVTNSLNQQSMNLEDVAGEQEVSIETIDGFAKRNNISCIDLLKIDTEGYELNVLKGAAGMLKNKQIKLIFAEAGFSEKLDVQHTFLPHLVEYLFGMDYYMVNIYGFNAYALQKGIQYADALFIQKSLIKTE